MEDMILELGKTYEHTTGRVIRVLGRLDTTHYGSTLVAEDQASGVLIPVGDSVDSAVNWRVRGGETRSTRRYHKRPIIIEAIRWDGTNWDEVCDFLPVPDNGHGDTETMESTDTTTRMAVLIHTLEGDMRAELGDWIIRGVKGEVYPCRNDIFEMTYEPVDNRIEEASNAS